MNESLWHSIDAHGFVWDPNLLDWVREEQPIIEGGTITVGTVDQGASGLDPWLVSGSVSAAVTGSVSVSNAAGASAVNIQDGGNTITVDGSVSAAVTGTVTANAGSNLNTSLLALESGGNLASVKTNTDKIPSQGQALMSASMPVVLASDQSAIQTASNAGVSGANSSTTPLAANATFTGSPVDMLNYATVRVSVFADANSAQDGWQVQFSQDATNWDFVQKATYFAGTSGYCTFNRIARYMQVVFINSGDAQSVFRLQTLIAPNSPEFTRRFIGQPLTDSSNGIIVDSIVSARTANQPGSPYAVATIKPSSTSSDMTDTALVVTQRESPLSPVWSALLAQSGWASVAPQWTESPHV